VIQEVNLYRGILKPERTPLSAQMIGMALILAVLVMAGVYAYLDWRLDTQRAELERLETEQTRAAERLNRLNERISAREVDPALERRVRELESELAIKRRLTGVIGGDRGNVEGFSQLLAPLARRRIEGLWLQEIVFREGGREIALRGRTLEARHVPSYLEALRAEPTYQGRRFGRFRMQRADDAKGLGFVIATRCADAAGDKGISQAAACLDGEP